VRGVWVRRSNEELGRISRRKRFAGLFLVVAFAIFFSIFGIFKTSFWETVETGNIFVPEGERLSRLPGLFIWGLIIGGLLFKTIPRPWVVCPKCGKMERKERFAQCECGGFFEYLDEMKWIADE
jgi:hypothetical protein